MICVDDIDFKALNIKGNPTGKRSRPRSNASSGRYVKAAFVKAGERYFNLAADATLRAALSRQGGLASANHLDIQPVDIRKKRYKRPRKTLIVFVVDASDSMGQGTHVRMKAAKGAALAILTMARVRHLRVGMVAFRDKSAQVVLQPTESLALARERLKTLPTGGATPFADGMMKAWRMIKAQRMKDPAVQPLLVVISDGDANVAYDRRSSPMDTLAELLVICRKMEADRIHAIAIDTKPRPEGSGGMISVARALQGTYYHIDGLKAKNLVTVVSGFDHQDDGIPRP